jgi:hypothetical protein
MTRLIVACLWSAPFFTLAIYCAWTSPTFRAARARARRDREDLERVLAAERRR